jgi:GTP-binding protein
VVAFAGRSNVGKSSLINALTGRKTLAKVSNTPGRTRQLNFFALAERLMLVDLPGYGYAEASKRAVADWTELIQYYLKGRPNLRRALVLIDSRHGIKQSDRDIIALLDEAAVNYQIVLTKTDKLTAAELDARGRSIAAELVQHTAAHPDILATSAESGAGLDELKLALLALAAPPPMR